MIFWLSRKYFFLNCFIIFYNFPLFFTQFYNQGIISFIFYSYLHALVLNLKFDLNLNMLFTKSKISETRTSKSTLQWPVSYYFCCCPFIIWCSKCLTVRYASVFKLTFCNHYKDHFNYFWQALVSQSQLHYLCLVNSPVLVRLTSDVVGDEVP